ncbi:MAG: 7-carboxy-7-deazaguanine synthase QueE [Candidatus Omnitrophota bacterium]
MKAKVTEIFKSIQGEGIYLGVPQVFVRFHGCNCDCSFCDTKHEYFEEISLWQMVSLLHSYDNYHSLSLTGGEPLLQTDFLQSLLPLIKDNNKLIYLETNGILYENLRRVVEYVDIVSMDFKLPSSCANKDYFRAHAKFLRYALESEVFVKVVITANSNDKEVIRAACLIRDICDKVFFIIQPEHPYESILQDKAVYFLNLAKKYIPNVKIIPQIHSLLGVK